MATKTPKQTRSPVRITESNGFETLAFPIPNRR